MDSDDVRVDIHDRAGVARLARDVALSTPADSAHQPQSHDMYDLDSHLLSLAEADLVVLHAYQQAERALAAEVPRSTESDGEDIERNRWIGRIREIDGISRDAIAPIHGRLIALGYLQFQLQGRDAGVVYRLTSEGRNALAAAKGESVLVAPIRKSA